MDQDQPVTCGFLVAGRVQGVGFRAFVRSEGQRLGLRGWVRNLSDGRVEAVASGPARAVAELRGRLRKGPAGARVMAVEEVPAEPPDEPEFVVVF